jgi:hypothetical protein
MKQKMILKLDEMTKTEPVKTAPTKRSLNHPLVQLSWAETLIESSFSEFETENRKMEISYNFNASFS